jgi:hypothetical protein
MPPCLFASFLLSCHLAMPLSISHSPIPRHLYRPTSYSFSLPHPPSYHGPFAYPPIPFACISPILPFIHYPTAILPIPRHLCHHIPLAYHSSLLRHFAYTTHAFCLPHLAYPSPYASHAFLPHFPYLPFSHAFIHYPICLSIAVYAQHPIPTYPSQLTRALNIPLAYPFLPILTSLLFPCLLSFSHLDPILPTLPFMPPCLLLTSVLIHFPPSLARSRFHGTTYFIPIDAIHSSFPFSTVLTVLSVLPSLPSHRPSRPSRPTVLAFPGLPESC